MPQAVKSQDLKKDTQCHGGNSESMIADSSHGDNPGNDYRDKCGPGQIGIDSLHGAKPEEANKED